MDLKAKIARLVEERGWNQEDFARQSRLNRETVRDILCQGSRKLRNATISTCARTLGLTVTELRDLPLNRLTPRMDKRPAIEDADATACRLYEEATQPELRAWLDDHPERARQLTADDIDELLSLQGTGGPLTALGVEHFVELLQRRKALLEKVQVVASTHYLVLLEQLVNLLYEKVLVNPEK
jgi:transcriptional regulator with XRE-family HTH domain